MQTNIREWLSEMREHFQEHPSRAPLYVLYSWYLMLWFGITSRYPVGTNVYDREWDVLIVLDACRVDTLREVADEYDFIDDVDEMWSVGSHSAEWLAQTFTEEYRSEIERTRYITGNPHVSRVLEQQMTPPMNNTPPIDFSKWDFVETDTFETVDKIWEESYDDTYRVTLPNTTTDYAITAGRTHDPEKLIVHYMQPHLPYIGQALPENRSPTEIELDGYKKLESGDVNRETIYELYKDTLRAALDEIDVLLQNIDAETVAITADHGEEFGDVRAYGHPEGFPHPVVKKVPWVKTTARDIRTHDPDLDPNRSANVDLEKHLQDLGYR